MMMCSISIKMETLINICLIVILHLINAEQNLQCGDWDAFKDEKCFKVLDNKELQSYDDAKNTCYQMEGSGLVSIRTLEEQMFLINLLRNVHKVVNDIWIGALYKVMLFKWSDNTTTNYTNWSDNNPKNGTSDECVQISMDALFLGKWFVEPCNKKNVVVCQKSQNWLFSYLQKNVLELRENVDRHNQEMESLKSELEMTKSQLQSEIKKQVSEATPEGTIAYFTQTSAPTGWLKANGQTVSRTTYANLFSIIGTTFGSGDGSTTFTLPDLRGEFIRGWSDGKDIDKNRHFGSFQWGSNIPLAGRIAGEAGLAYSSAEQSRWGFSASSFDDGFEANIPSGQTRDGMTFPNDEFANLVGYIKTTNTGNITNWNVMKGTRPRNVALLACIKY